MIWREHNRCCFDTGMFNETTNEVIKNFQGLEVYSFMSYIGSPVGGVKHICNLSISLSKKKLVLSIAALFLSFFGFFFFLLFSLFLLVFVSASYLSYLFFLSMYISYINQWVNLTHSTPQKLKKKNQLNHLLYASTSYTQPKVSAEIFPTFQINLSLDKKLIEVPCLMISNLSS